MNEADFSQFLIKLDRNKASVSVKPRNTPVWQVDVSYNSMGIYSTGSCYDLTAMIGLPCWNGLYHWNGEGIWRAS